MFKLVLILKLVGSYGIAAVPLDGGSNPASMSLSYYDTWARCQEAGDYVAKQGGDRLSVYYLCVPTGSGLREGLK